MKITLDLTEFFAEKDKPHVVIFDVERNFGSVGEWEIRTAVWEHNGKPVNLILGCHRKLVYERALEIEARGDRIGDGMKVRIHRVGDIRFNNREGFVSGINRFFPVVPITVDFNDGVQGQINHGYFHDSELEVLEIGKVVA